MAAQLIQQTPPPIPVKDTVRIAWQMSKAEWRPLFKILALPSLLLAITGAGAMAPVTTSLSMQQGIFILLYLLAGILIKPWVGVAGLRYLILGETSKFWWPNYQPRMWRYMWKIWMVAFCVAVPIGVGTAICFYPIT